MRGKARDEVITMTDYGITPAYAGKSQCNAHPHDRVKDHPRLCGEKLDFKTRVNREPGSPPPMRGKVIRFHVVTNQNRITPAYAGKSARFPV